MTTVRIVVFANAPMPGVAKTRLAPALGLDGAAQLAARLLRATLDAAVDAALGPVELCMEPQPGTPEWQGMAIRTEVELSAQGDGDLGLRLARAASRTVERGEAVMLIGSDCAEMSVALLRQAAERLIAIGAVIVGAADGGYVLLGLTQFSPELFRAMPWSTERVAAETLQRFSLLGWPLHVGPTYHDVEVPADLAHVPAQWLAEIHAVQFE
jgi:rSAM/selenodomain-associated transferase 1